MALNGGSSLEPPPPPPGPSRGPPPAIPGPPCDPPGPLPASPSPPSSSQSPLQPRFGTPPARTRPRRGGSGWTGRAGHGGAAAPGLPNAGELLPGVRDDSAAGQGAAAAVRELPGPRGGTRCRPPPPGPPRPERCEGAAAAFRGSPPAAPEPPGADPGADDGTGAAVAAARAALLQKLLWAARELPRSGSVEGSARLCRLVRDCALALRGLRDLEPPGATPDPPRGSFETF
uniref:protein ZNRD2 n=1 Tax=Agelaius phoeniceus TaxID=39638 RepID=UPI0023EB433E|nr:protein ZNRD2 [Agelaius phoeniceus]